MLSSLEGDENRPKRRETFSATFYNNKTSKIQLCAGQFGICTETTSVLPNIPFNFKVQAKHVKSTNFTNKSFYYKRWKGSLKNKIKAWKIKLNFFVILIFCCVTKVCPFHRASNTCIYYKLLYFILTYKKALCNLNDCCNSGVHFNIYSYRLIL